MFFHFVTKHACVGQSVRQTDRQNYDPQDRASVAASRGINPSGPVHSIYSRTLKASITDYFCSNAPYKNSCDSSLKQVFFPQRSTLSLLATDRHGVKILTGTQTDSELMTAFNHVAVVCQSGFFVLKHLRSIRQSLTVDATQTLVGAFVSNLLDYRNQLLVAVSGQLIN